LIVDKYLKYCEKDFDMGNVANILENAERIGNVKDEPEGSRYIQISETLVNKMLGVLAREMGY